MTGLIFIRNALPSDIPSIVRLARSIGRMIGHEHEIATWMEVDPDGFFVAQAKVEGKNEVIGVTTAVNLSHHHSFFGLGIVEESYRHRGILSEFFKSCLNHCAHRNAGAWAYEDNFKLLQKRGFIHTQDYRSLRYSCCNIPKPYSATKSTDIRTMALLSNVHDRTPENCTTNWSSHRLAEGFRYQQRSSGENLPLAGSENIDLHSTSASSHELTGRSFGTNRSSESTQNLLNLNFNEELYDKIIAYDYELHGYDRSIALRGTFACPSNITRVALCSGRVVGYGCLRPVISGYTLVSPFYADSIKCAEVLLRDLLHSQCLLKHNKGLITYIPDTNEEGRYLLQKYGFIYDDVMLNCGYNKQPVKIDCSRIFGFLSMSFCSE